MQMIYKANRTEYYWLHQLREIMNRFWALLREDWKPLTECCLWFKVVLVCQPQTRLCCYLLIFWKPSEP